MQSTEVASQIPEYQRGVEFTDVEDENKALEKGRAFIDAAERDGTMTRSQILVSRIELILDNAPEAELNKQKELIATFISTEPVASVITSAQNHGKESSHKFQAILPEDYEKYKFRIDAAEALALVKNNQEALAREIVQRGKTIDRVEGRLKYFWSYYPHGTDIVDNWQRLAKN